METKYCACCTQKMSSVPFVGDKTYELEDGSYCEKCARIIIEKRREEL